MSDSILYCGDTSLDGAAAYLAGLLETWQFPFDYVPSDRVLNPVGLRGRRLVILSDFPATGMDAEAQSALLAAVDDGTGLLMIGGWESFHGAGGDWETTAVADALPVVILPTDDRLNCDHPVVLRQVAEHTSVRGLPWAERPPVVGGFNRFTPKPASTVVLEADRLRTSYDGGRHNGGQHNGGQWSVETVETHPMLVFGEYGAGPTAALATDVAPHWVGGFVDWGDGRVRAQAAGAEEIEVGDLYARFWRQLLSFLAGQDLSSPAAVTHVP